MARSDEIWEELVAHEAAGSPDDRYQDMLLKQLKMAEYAEELADIRLHMKVVITEEGTL